MASRSRIHRRVQRFLPPQLQTSGMERFGLDPGQFWQLAWSALPLRAPSCGAVVLRLSEQTARDIRQRRLGFFEHARTAREAPPPRAVRYHAWQPSPLPVTWRDGIYDNGLRGGLPCIDADAALRRKLSGAHGHGAYYAVQEGGGGMLVAIPDHHLLVYSWRD